MDPIDIITTKRDGGELSPEQIDWIIGAYANGDDTTPRVADEQMAALAMAILWRGMTRAELSGWTAAMLRSGKRLDFTGLERPTVDKHSTGGVGDAITVALTPTVVACGAAVPQLSGRGLGHTGGTLDKLESVPGWRSDLSPTEMRRVLEDVGGVVCAPGPELAPADRRLYALRDATATVDSLPLIASSVMSKKLAEGTGALVLDVKVGSGAFMPDTGSARELAQTMVDLGADHGVPTRALLTAMDTPLGYRVGNALEVAEAVEVLAGGGPADMVELTVTLGREMLAAAGMDGPAARDPAAALADGSAMDTWRRMVRAQGGDPMAPLPEARETTRILVPESGELTRLDARAVGEAARRLGAGRSTKEDSVSPGAGITLHAKPGDDVRAGSPLATLHADDPARFGPASEALAGAYEVGGKRRTFPLVVGKLG
ncbi:thymidine phosphorylase [Haloactinospora alba]|uniref:Thymidine phosphorylase n=1 Tax=Haloactinospora alba TaxID=405555 RepID=A0A543NGL3_9ACTN|nr:thymidine phosphorylase [Haloactinospora alba]TQN30997.1 thymidine phosphorylase [Haloactinospora alba]